MAIFVRQAKMQLHQVNENQNSFAMNLRVLRQSVRSRWICIRSEVSSGHVWHSEVMMNISWGQRLGFFVRGQNAIEWHTCPRIDLWPHADSSWPHRWRHSQINFNSVWFSLTWRNCIFAWLTKIATELLLTFTLQWFCNWGTTRY